MSEYTKDQKDLLAHLEANKAETLAWVAVDPENRMAGYATTDLDHWASYGIFSIAQYERHTIEANIYDLYKDVHGIRPRWINFKEMSDTEIQKEYDFLLNQLNENIAREQAQEDAAIEKIMNIGAPDKETAQRWLQEAEEWGY